MKKQKSFSEVAMLWKENKRNQVKRSTLSIYSLMLQKHLLPAFGHRTRVTEAHVQQFVDNKLLTLSPKTVQDLLTVLKMVYRHGVKLRLLPHEEWRVNIPGAAWKRDVEVLTVAHQKRLLDFVTRNFSLRNLGLMICLCTGMRIGEVCALKWQDINQEKRTVVVTKTVERISVAHGTGPRTQLVVGTPKTRNSHREIPLSSQLFGMIAPLLKVVNPDFFILTNDSRPTEPRTYRNHFNRLLKQLGIPAIKFHAMRHSFATRCIESDCDYKTVSALLGHASVSTTLNLYVHPTLTQKHRCIQRMCRHLAK